MNESASTAKSYAVSRYGTSDKCKLSRHYYQGDIECAHLSGQLTILEKILKEHKENPCENLDVLIGEIQLMAKDVYNFTVSKYASRTLRTRRLEDYL